MKTISIILALLLIAILASSAFIVREGETALLLQFGRIVSADDDTSGYKPGLHFKLPFVQQVLKFDQRILNLEEPEERYYTLEKKSVSVDFFVKWQIQDTAAFYKATGGDPLVANQRIAPNVKDALRFEFNARPLPELISGGRADITERVREQVNKATEGGGKLGIHIVDIRIKRIELPTEVNKSVFDRMRAERTKMANQLRAEGEEASRRIKADADRQVQVLKAEATKEAEIARGEGDAQAAEIYAAAYGKDPDFYAFYRSLEAYRQTFQKDNSVLILDSKSEFFRYFNESK